MIGRREEGIIVSAARLSSTTVDSIMVPIEFVSYLYVGASLAEALVAAHLEMHTRYPVTEQQHDPQSFIGYVNFKDIVATLRLAPTNLRCAASCGRWSTSTPTLRWPNASNG